MKLTVVIVSYNVKFYLEQCLSALQKALRGIEAEVCVVDNHSRDGSVEYLSAAFPQVRFVASAHNLGFARANNLAIRDTRSQYVLLLNPDTIVGEHTLSQALSFMDSHAGAGSLGVRMLDTRGVSALESRRGLPTPLVAFYKMAGLCARFPRSRRFGHYYMSGLPWDQAAPIEVVSGAFCLLRREAISRVGSLDEDFFMYGEDIDLSYRILKGGYTNYYLPSLILHYKGESTQKSSFRYVHVFYEAMLIFFRKHYQGASLLFSLPVKLAIYAKAMLALVQMLIDKARKSLGFVSSEWKSPQFIFVGNAATLESCRALASRRGLQALYEECDAAGLAQLFARRSAFLLAQDSKMQQYWVFDTSLFGYEEIFALFMSHPRQQVKMAFYHPDTGRVITENEVYC